MSSTRNSDAENFKADIVVVGGGGAGLPAAIAAVEAGAKNIILLEKRRALGGNAQRAIVMFAVESPAQKRIGVNYTRDQAFKDKMDYSNWTVDPRVVRTLVNATSEITEWLENKGLKFGSVTRGGFRGQYPKEYPKVSHILSLNPEERLGKRLIEMLAKNCRDVGVQILRETAAKKILTDKKGKVTGVLAVKKGKEIKIATKAAIIAAGGFTGNKEMMDKYLPAKGFRLSLSLPYTGDGLIMAAEVGAVIDDVITQPLIGPHHYPYAISLNHLLRRPEVIWINKRGERFYDESFYWGHMNQATNSLSRQPDEICYALIDSEALRNMIKKKELCTEMDEFFLYGGSGGFEAKLGPGARTTWFDKLYDDFKIDDEKGVAKIANTLEEIAQFIGTSPEVLKTTVEQYNFYCDQGYDADFLKDKEFLLPLRTPPYYAVLGRQGYDCTLGGIKINQFMEVINKKCDPISGLYAVGDNAGSCISSVYHPKHAGTTLSFAICGGYIAGENAAKYVLGEG